MGTWQLIRWTETSLYINMNVSVFTALLLFSVFFICLFFRYGKLLPFHQTAQFSAAAGLSRLLIILGVEPKLKVENASEEVVQRQVRLESTNILQL